MKRSMARALAGLGTLAAFAITGCSGGGGNALPPRGIGSTAAPSSPAVPTVAPIVGATAVSVALSIPLASSASASSRRRKPKYVSAVTNSLSIAQGSGAAKAISLAMGSPSCSTGATARVCTVTIPATAGANQTFTLRLFASSDGSGSPLSAQAVVANVTAGATTQIPAAFDGVVSALSVFLENPTLVAGQAGSTAVVVNGLDATGAVIVGPGVFSDANGNPIVVTLTDSDASGATKLAQTTVTQAATVPLSYSGGASIAGATISASAGSLAPVTATLGIRAAGATFDADRVNAAISSTQQAYATMAHVNPARDVKALAAEMVASGAYASTTISPGGISATLPDGTRTFIFADRQEDLVGGNAPPFAPSAGAGPSTTANGRASANATRTRAYFEPNDPTSPHQVALLTNHADTAAFHPSNQALEAVAYRFRGIGTKNSGVDALDVSLDAILALAPAHIDVLDLSTHGGVEGTAPNQTFIMESTTPISAANDTKYAADLLKGYLIPGGVLLPPPFVEPPPHYLFTMPFLTEHLTFNPGALFYNYACFGQSPITSGAIGAQLSAAGVGRYIGWTKEVEAVDADTTDAFVVDRTLGEAGDIPIGLGPLVAQRNPLQRAFPLDDVQTAMTTEQRQAPNARPYAYDVSDYQFADNIVEPPLADGSAAKFLVSDYGNENIANPPLEYAWPSISTMQVSETTSGGTLTIYGRFPPTQGTVRITSASGDTPLPVTSWATDAIVATLPIDGTGASGAVTVTTADDIESESEPLTQWAGTLGYDETDSLPNLGTIAGSGTGTVSVRYEVAFRADVHPVVTTLDMPPVAQNFAFENVEADSTATVTAYDGTFRSTDGKSVSTFSTLPGSTTLTPTLSLVPGTFVLSPTSNSTHPAPCNDGAAGPSDGAGNVACPFAGWFAPNVVMCLDSGSKPACQPYTSDDTLSIYGFDAVTGGTAGILALTMDPKTYGVTVSGTTTTFMSSLFSGDSSVSARPATAQMTGKIGAPVNAPMTRLRSDSTRVRRHAVSHGWAK